MYRVLSLIEEFTMVICITGAFGCGLMQVILRYVFNTGFPWSEGVLIVLTVWAGMMAGSRAVREGYHVRVEVIADSLRQPFRRWVAVASEIVCIIFTGVLCYAGYLYTQFVWSLGAISAEATIPEWLIYGVVPISMACFALRHVQRLWLAFTVTDEPSESLEEKMARSL